MKSKKKIAIDRNSLFVFAEKFFDGFLNENHPYIIQSNIRKNLRIYNALSFIFILLITLLLPRLLVIINQNPVLIIVLILYFTIILSLIINYITKFKYFLYFLNFIIFFKISFNFFLLIDNYEMPPLFLSSVISNLILLHLIYNRWISFIYFVSLMIVMLFHYFVFQFFSLNNLQNIMSFFYDFVFSSILIWIILEVYEHLKEKLEWKLIQNNSLREKEIALASTLQQQFHPIIKDSKNYILDYKIIPYDKVSGDIIEVIEKEEEYWIVIGDVTGHGLHSGMLAMVIHTLFNYLMNEKQIDNIYQLFIELNNHYYNTISKLNIKNYSDLKIIHIYSNGEIEIVGSLSYIIHYDHKKNILKRFKKELVFLLGMNICNDISQIPSLKIHLKNKDALLFCTDGAIETLFNKENKISVLQVMKELKKSLVLNELNLQKFFEYFQGNEDKIKKRDDITLFLIKYEPKK